MGSSSSYPFPSCNLNSPHVLVVSAWGIHRQTHVSLFKARSWRVSEAESMDQAMQILNPGRKKGSKIDLVCAVHFEMRPTSSVNYTLPTLNALELLRKIKESPCTKDLPVVVASFFREREDITFMEEGAEAVYFAPMDGYDVQNFVELLGFPIEFAQCNDDLDQ